MAELYRFFASTPTDTREYNQEDWATVIAGLSGDGVIARVGNRLEVIPTTPNTMAIIVKDGAAWLQGYWYQNTADKEITIPAADVSYARYDRIVLRLDKFVNRKIEAIVKTGTPSSSPSPPALEQTSDYWEISLAKIYVPANATAITNITDEREMVAHEHTQGTDQYLDYGGANQVAVADVKDAVDKKHKIYISTSKPSGGSDGDVWFKYTA